VKNFAALFIASAFLAGLFLQVAVSMQGMRASGSSSRQAVQGTASGDAALIIVKPIFFLAVFLDSLTYSFLPRFMQDAAVASGMSASVGSLPFTLYYLFFAASLIPAGTLADRHGPVPVIVAGLLVAGASVFGLALPVGIPEMAVLRALAGIGQGMLLIGFQNYLLAVTPAEKKTQGMAIIVLGFQGGMISGMALGSLLVNFLNYQGIFITSGIVGVATAVYTIVLLPGLAERKQAHSGLPAAIQRLVTDLKKVVSNREFLKTMFCIGIPAKAILTGGITFALPLILSQQEYRPEDVGQLVMLYGLGVVATTGFVSRLVDRSRNTEMILFSGAVLSGIGLTLIGFMGSSLVGDGLSSTALVIIGVTLVGIAHGFINAPVVTHVGQSALAKRIGVNPVTTTYRFLERGGHIMGPLLLAQLFLIWGQGAYVIGGIGVATAILGLMFIAHKFRTRVPVVQTEPAQ
jgi:MFS family permease